MANCGPWVSKWCKKNNNKKKKGWKTLIYMSGDSSCTTWTTDKELYSNLTRGVFFFFSTDKRLKIDAVYLRDHRGRHTTLNRATPEPQVSAHPGLKTTFPGTDNPVRLPPAGRETLARRRLSPTTPSHYRTCAVNVRAASLIIGSFRRWPPWAVN